MRGLGWVTHVYSLGIRKTLSYRADFWVSFLGALAVQFIVSYFLWLAIFESTGKSEMGGYTFHGMMGYYLLVPFIAKTINGLERGFLASEIYEGTLTRYLIYPVPPLLYKLVWALSSSTVALVQLLISVLLYLAFFDAPGSLSISVVGLICGSLAVLLSSVLMFFLAATFDMAAFWFDNAWSLQVLLMFVINMLGGGLIPLSLYPESMQASLEFLPFRLLYSVPIQLYLGQMSPLQFAYALPYYFGWTLVAIVASREVWRRGIYKFGGVGI